MYQDRLLSLARQNGERGEQYRSLAIRHLWRAGVNEFGLMDVCVCLLIVCSRLVIELKKSLTVDPEVMIGVNSCRRIR